MEMEIVNDITMESRIEKVKIRYDFLPKYCTKCKLQGHDEQECRVLHPKLKIAKENVSQYGELESRAVKEQQGMKKSQQWNDTKRRFINKGYIIKKDISSAKEISNSNPFDILTDENGDQQKIIHAVNKTYTTGETDDKQGERNEKQLTKN